MRVIDADALIEKLDAELEGGYYSPHDVISLLMTQPTIKLDWTEMLVICDNCGHAIHVKRTDAKSIIEPERKKGKWKRAYLDHEAMGERPSILYCSICNQCIAYPTNYCPNCGADMRGE